MRYELKKNLAGAYTVKFKCPKCSVKLSESLKNAGQQDACPECGQAFVIPGVEELTRQKEEQALMAAERAAKRDADQAEKQRSREEKKRKQEQAQREREQDENQRWETANARPLPKKPIITDRGSSVRHSGFGLALLSTIMFLYSAFCTFDASAATEITVMQQIVLTLRIYGSLLASCVLLVGSCLCHVIARK